MTLIANFPWKCLTLLNLLTVMFANHNVDQNLPMHLVFFQSPSWWITVLSSQNFCRFVFCKACSIIHGNPQVAWEDSSGGFLFRPSQTRVYSFLVHQWHTGEEQQRTHCQGVPITWNTVPLTTLSHTCHLPPLPTTIPTLNTTLLSQLLGMPPGQDP